MHDILILFLLKALGIALVAHLICFGNSVGNPPDVTFGSSAGKLPKGRLEIALVCVMIPEVHLGIEL